MGRDFLHIVNSTGLCNCQVIILYTIGVPENDQPSFDFNKPLYDNANISFGAAITLLMLFTQKFHLSGAALSMLIEMLNILLPPGHLLPKSLYLFKKLFTSLSPSPKFHYFCKECFMKVNKESNQCTNVDCKQSAGPNMKKSYFLEFDIRHQIKSILKVLLWVFIN